MNSVGRNSVIMASGTAASRITGQIRTILLAAALGTTGTAINAYQTGAMIPQVMFTLISGGVFNAVLVPQIVRTLKSKHAEEHLNKLVTSSVVLLLLITFVLMMGTSVLTSIYLDARWTGEQRGLVNAFTLWCMPQIFFYGLYTILGQILAAKGKFATYAWSSVGANVISCIGFVLFIVLFGNAQRKPMEFWTPWTIALTAGAWTLGVAFQALILFIPLMRSGFRFHWRWGLRGIGLRSMGPVAAWSLGVVVVNQLANVINARITNGAPLAGNNPFGIAGNGSYQNAFAIYILPYSLIAVSVTTAMFPRLSKAVAEHHIGEARLGLSQALRNVGLLMAFFSVAMIVMPVPITRALLPSVNVHEAVLISQPLVGLSYGLVISGAFLLVQRTFYALEDGLHPFIFAAMTNILQVGIVLLATKLLPPEQWTGWVGFSMTLGNIISFPFLIWMLRKQLGGSIDGKKIGMTYTKILISAVVSVVVGMVLSTPVAHFVGASLETGHERMSWIQAILMCILLCVVVGIVYFGSLFLMRTEELLKALSGFNGQLHRIFKGLAARGTEPAVQESPAAGSLPPGHLKTPEQATAPSAEKGRISTGQSLIEQASDGESSKHSMTPKLGDTIIDRYTLMASLRDEAGLQAWRAHDSVLARDCQLFFVTDGAVASQCNTYASGLALSRNRHFTPVYHFSEAEGVALIITALDAGVSLSDYLAGSTVGTLSNEAMRTIVGEIAEALIALKRADLPNPTICTDTIRLSSTGIMIADAPINSMLVDPLGIGKGRTLNEEMVTKQLSAVLYAMLTRTPDVQGMTFAEQKLPVDIPDEFRIICSRGLGMKRANGSPAVPLRTLAEFEALLGAWTPPEELSDRDIVWPEHAGEGSIEKVGVRVTDSHAVRDIPESFATASKAAGNAQAEPQWATNQLLFPESDEVQMVHPDSSNGDLFAAFEDFPYIKPIADRYPENATSALDVSALRAAKAVGDGEVPTNTGEIPETTASIPLETIKQQAEAVKEKEAEEQQDALNQEMTSSMQPLPPSFTPKPRTRRPVSQEYSGYAGDSSDDDDSDSADSGKKLFGVLSGRTVSIIAGILLIVAALTWAVNGLLDATIGSSDEDNTKSNWPEMTNVPFRSTDTASTSGGAENTEASPSSSASTTSETKVTHDDKVANAAPSPSVTPTPENTTAFPTGTQTFLSQPAGLAGRGWYVHLTQPQQVSRLVISIRQSGGQGQIFVNSTAGAPNQGDPVAQFTFDPSGTTTVTLPSPVSTQDLVVWVPLDSTPSGGLYFNSVKVY